MFGKSPDDRPSSRRPLTSPIGSDRRCSLRFALYRMKRSVLRVCRKDLLKPRLVALSVVALPSDRSVRKLSRGRCSGPRLSDLRLALVTPPLFHVKQCPDMVWDGAQRWRMSRWPTGLWCHASSVSNPRSEHQLWAGSACGPEIAARFIVLRDVSRETLESRSWR